MTHSAGGYDCTKADGRQWLQKLGNTYGITLLSYLPLNWFLLLGWLGFVVSCFPLCVSQSMMWAIKFLNCDTYPKGISILRLGIKGAYSRFFNRKITCRWCKKWQCGSHEKISLNEPAKCFLVLCLILLSGKPCNCDAWADSTRTQIYATFCEFSVTSVSEL